MATKTEERANAKKEAAAKKAAASDKAAESAMNAKKDKAPVAGKGPEGKPWVEWIKQQDDAGMSRKEIQDKYVELRSAEETYKGRQDVLKRHAYRHVRLALGEPPKQAATA